ncbi:hypothetical protein F2Q69_00048591 [Brassica cretica]|uniref:Uncharacterized protein n=1 Tax=Brassica cretica TaxID=69181 RepID=A0A8S9PYF3_BRACR|nr:hypothetical protein F2Q69_00048591 [Brassica cretica]
MCCAFLWSGSPNQTHKTKVSWTNLCYPKAEGGLGVRRLRDSYKVFALKLIWCLFTQHRPPLLVCWVKFYFFMVAPSGCSKSRMRNQPTCGLIIGWIRGGLIDVTSAAGTTYIGLPRRATVSDAVKQNEWAI